MSILVENEMKTKGKLQEITVFQFMKETLESEISFSVKLALLFYRNLPVLLVLCNSLQILHFPEPKMGCQNQK